MKLLFTLIVFSYVQSSGFKNGIIQTGKSVISKSKDKVKQISKQFGSI